MSVAGRRLALSGTIAALAILLAALVMRSQGAPTGPASPAVGEPDPRAVAYTDPGTQRQHSGPAQAEDGAEDGIGRELPAGTLRVLFEGASEPVTMEHWTGSSPQELWTRLAGGGAGDRRDALGSECRLAIPAGQWALVRVAVGRRTRTRLVEPFSGEHPESFDFGTPGSAVGVLVLSHDQVTPAAGRSVVLENPSAGDRTSESFREVATGPAGTVRFEGVSSGAWTVRLGGNRPTLGPPHATRVLLVPGMPNGEPFVVLVEPEPSIDQAFRLQAMSAPEPGAQPRVVYVSRIEGGPFLMRALPQLRSVEEVVRLSLPPGRYRVQSLPQGESLVSPETFVASAAAAVDLRVSSVTERVQLRLLGIDEQAFPFTVRFEADGEPLPSDASQLYLGRYRWREVELAVAPIRRPGRIVVTGRRRFVSELLPLLSGATVSPRMEPARQLLVQWTGISAVDAAESWLVVESGDVVRICMLQSGLFARHGFRVPGHEARMTIGRQAGLVEMFGPDGESRWRRTFAPGAEDVIFAVDSAID